MKKYITECDGCGEWFELDIANQSFCPGCSSVPDSPARPSPNDNGLPPIACEQCGDLFAPKSRRASVCSQRCRDTRKALRGGVTCSLCGEPMQASRTTAKRSPAHNSCRRKRAAGHGSAHSYSRGCRCDSCRAAKTESMREYVARYKAEHGFSPSFRYKREAKGLPLEVASCSVCGEPLARSYFREGVVPTHKRCKPRGAEFIEAWDRHTIYVRDSWSCHLCYGRVDVSVPPMNGRYPTLDHVVPKSLGGSDDPDNLRTAHRWCNSARGVRSVDEFRDVYGIRGEGFYVPA